MGRPSLQVALTDIRIERFWAKVEKAGDDECWLWTAATNGYGYGALSIGNGINTSAHRFAWALHFGEFDEDAWVLHHCDNPPCVNPAHLFLGDPLANVQDMDAKGRRVAKGYPPKTHCKHGHAYTEENAYISPKGDKSCKACRKIAAAKQRATDEWKTKHAAYHVKWRSTPKQKARKAAYDKAYRARKKAEASGAA